MSITIEEQQARDKLTIFTRPLDRFYHPKDEALLIKWTDVLNEACEHTLSANIHKQLVFVKERLDVVISVNPRIRPLELFEQYGLPPIPVGIPHFIEFAIKVYMRIYKIPHCMYNLNTDNEIVRCYTTGFCHNVYGYNIELLLIDDIPNPIEAMNLITKSIIEEGIHDTPRTRGFYNQLDLVKELGNFGLTELNRSLAIKFGASKLSQHRSFLTNDYTTLVINKY